MEWLSLLCKCVHISGYVSAVCVFVCVWEGQFTKICS